MVNTWISSLSFLRHKFKWKVRYYWSLDCRVTAPYAKIDIDWFCIGLWVVED